MKRIFDLCISALLLAIFSPLLLLIVILIFVNLGSPVVFCQYRPGLKGNIFRMYKFRTMKELYNSDGVPLPDQERLTSFGKFLRSTSLDELPGLINVLKGEMSLVGPRPLLVEYLPLYTAEQARRHEVRPGITGWAQVNGRNALSWEEKFNLDVWYVNNQSFFLDLKILFRTFKKVFIREGISSDGHVTMEKFTGTKE